jgi:hypothetical protein
MVKIIPNIDTTTKLRPKLKAVRSMKSTDLFLISITGKSGAFLVFLRPI